MRWKKENHHLKQLATGDTLSVNTHTVYGDVESEYLTYYNLKNDSFKVTAWHPHKKVAPETLNIAIKSIKSSNK